MILQGPQPLQLQSTANWQQLLDSAITDPVELLARLGLEASQVGLSEAARREFPMLVPLPYLEKIRPGDPADPLLLQVLPGGAEWLDRSPGCGYSRDPVGEFHASPVPGLIHKYSGRALLLVTGKCAIHCRYCFRRHFPYAEHRVSTAEWQRIKEYLTAVPNLREIILSGGDPLIAPNRYLARLTAMLEGIGQLQRLRIHTRMPVVLPQRVDEGLLDWLGSTTLTPVLVIHANHPRELEGRATADALSRLRRTGVTLLNQSVLLAGVNDNATCLSELSERLFELGVLPYYLHLLDPVAGAAHFALSQTKAAQLAGELARRLPGYLVPRLVREEAGRAAKVPILPA